MSARLSVNINDECADAIRRVKAARRIDTTEAIRRAIALLDYFEKPRPPMELPEFLQHLDRLSASRDQRVEQIARALYGYDNRGDRFDHASPDVLSPYYDLADIALRTMRESVAADDLVRLTEDMGLYE